MDGCKLPGTKPKAKELFGRKGGIKEFGAPIERGVWLKKGF